MIKAQRKVEQLENFCAIQNIRADQALVVGNGENDIGLFEYTGNGLLIQGRVSEGLGHNSWRRIQQLDDVRLFLEGQLASL